MFNEYFEKKIISTDLAQYLIYFRNKYNYPCVKLVISERPTDIRIGKKLWAMPDESEANLSTDLELDLYHHKLLHSSNPDQNLLGTASVIFWGFYTFKRTYALNKVKWHIEGIKSKSPSTPELIQEKLTGANSSIDVGKAMGEINTLSQLGSIPFASKVIAFMRPESAGIYDNQIHKGLINCDWFEASELNTRIGTASSKSVQSGYTRWCDFLSKIADTLNTEIENGQSWHWTDRSGKNYKWRALDVERALFNYFKSNKVQ